MCFYKYCPLCKHFTLHSDFLVTLTNLIHHRVCYPTEKNMNAGNHLVGGGNHSDSFGFFAIIVVVIFIVSITIIVFVIIFVFVIFNIMNGGSQSDSFGFRVDSPPSAQSVFSSSTIISTKTLEKSYKYVFDITDDQQKCTDG